MSQITHDKRVTIRLPARLLAVLQAEAEADSRTLAAAIREILMDREAGICAIGAAGMSLDRGSCGTRDPTECVSDARGKRLLAPR
jgi:hypothetical protein